MALCEQLGVTDGDVLAFYSGSKGYHVGIPTALWQPEPSAMFHRVARRFAEHVAEHASETGEVPVEVLARLMGHTNMKTTGFYFKVRDRRAVEGAKTIKLHAATAG